MPFPVEPPVDPMLAKVAERIPAGEGFLFEPKWDGFRAIVFRGADDVFIQSRDRRPLDRYFPELHDALGNALPPNCVLDGEVVIMTSHGLDFDLLQLRLHPAASRVRKLAAETPASFVAFDVLAADGVDLMSRPQQERRSALEQLLHDVAPPVYLTPATLDRALAEQWLAEFEGAGLDGVIAKPLAATYQPGKRAMLKIKHVRTADCVVAGFRWYKTDRDAVGSLLLGLHDARGRLQHVGVTSSFTMTYRKQLAKELAPLREGAMENHPWKEWARRSRESALERSRPEAARPDEPAPARRNGDVAPERSRPEAARPDEQAPAEAAGMEDRMPGGQSRWSAGKDLSWEPLRVERVCAVKYDHLQGDRFRHAATFLRWRFDRRPEDCRYDQLEVTTPYQRQDIFSSGSSGS